VRDAKENREKKMAARNPGGQERGEELSSRISRGHFFLAVFFRVTHDGLSERSTTRSLEKRRKAINGFGGKRVT